MSHPFNTNGRLNLEQQRKRAKELLPHLKTQDPNATLSVAQWTIAKQLGFSSWPKLKAHRRHRLRRPPPRLCRQ